MEYSPDLRMKRARSEVRKVSTSSTRTLIQASPASLTSPQACSGLAESHHARYAGIRCGGVLFTVLYAGHSPTKPARDATSYERPTAFPTTPFQRSAGVAMGTDVF